MKDLKFYIIIGLLALGLFFLWMDNCGGDKKLNELRGEHNQLLERNKVEKAESDRVREAKEKYITEIETDLIKMELEAEEKLAHKDAELTKKERKLEEVREQPLTINRLQTEVEILEGQIEDWKGKFNILKKAKDDMEFSLNEKYAAQVVISLEWMGLYESELELRIKGMEGMVECIKRLNRKKLTSKIKTGISLLLLSVVVYSFVK